MKTIRKLTAILLSVAILTVLSILPAAADESGAYAAEPVFITDNGRLTGIDFSAAIRDDTTVNTGNLVLLDENGNIRRHARFDEKQPGAAVFGVANQDGSFTLWPLHATAIDNAFCLRPESETEKLFDDIGSFAFSMHDIFANTAQAKIAMVSPGIAVTKADGEQVKEMTLDFSAKAYEDTPMFLDRVDMSKTLTLSVVFFGLFRVAEITLQPTAYDAKTGVLTVSVHNAEGQEGCALFDCGITINGGHAMTAYMYRLHGPDGLFFSSRNEKICSAEIGSVGFLNSAEGMPVRITADLRVPDRIAAAAGKVIEKLRPLETVVPVEILLVVPLLVFFAPSLIRAGIALIQSLKDYGFRLSPADWIKMVSGLIGYKMK